MLTVHSTVHDKLAQVAGVALLILAKLNTAHDGWLVQPQSEVLQEEGVETRGEGGRRGNTNTYRTCKPHEPHNIHHGTAKAGREKRREGGGQGLTQVLMQGHTKMGNKAEGGGLYLGWPTAIREPARLLIRWLVF